MNKALICLSLKAHFNCAKTDPNKKVKTPIIDTVYKVLYEQKNPKKAFLKLNSNLK